ncbi:hypothetical protein [Kitasatospora sp. CB02891]|uniref:hypothetical protein n=1 Tax=Kitasatospora sp. CB02891 TaxID=2020329 RepID=UPI000C26F827|nr:hypothetical protein [Kitasatospora sp. CB02891]PJN24959.1 hypothetical protein CG736_15835 [Kitasatospora sp. CB02891]
MTGSSTSAPPGSPPAGPSTWPGRPNRAESGRFAPYAAEYVRPEPLLYVPDQAHRRLTGEEWNRGTAHSCEACSKTEGRAQPRPTGVQAGPDGGASGGV